MYKIYVSLVTSSKAQNKHNLNLHHKFSTCTTVSRNLNCRSFCDRHYKNILLPSYNQNPEGFSQREIFRKNDYKVMIKLKEL